MFERGLAYESNEPINWCPSCKTGLANEDLEDGKCERCGAEFQWKGYYERKLCDNCLADVRSDAGGLYKEAYDSIRNTVAYKRWRETVLKRDGHKCFLCDSPATVVHHLVDLLTIIDVDWLVFDPDVGVSLCNSCHSKLHYEEKYNNVSL
jgi:predicted RNA-binding Zn-ribbon protein involved in translation (DUF1610 family)